MPTVRVMHPGDHEAVREFLLKSAYLYPDIDRWIDKKALPGLKTGERVGFLIDAEQRIDGLVIAKRGPRAKLCCLRIADDLKNQGWGTELLRRAAEQLAREGAREAYVTVSELVDDSGHDFFRRLGFDLCGRVRNKYVHGVDELVYRWPRQELLAFLDEEPQRNGACARFPEPALHKLPTMLMSLKPRFSSLILQGRKTVEFRRRFSRKHIGARVLFYVSRPARSFEFTAHISDVAYGTTDELWDAFQDEGGVDKATFDAYFQGRDAGYALCLSEVEPLPQPLDLSSALSACPELKPPQSFKRLEHAPSLVSLWSEAVGVNEGGPPNERWNPFS